MFVSQATERPEHVAACVACGKEAVRECSNAVRWEVPRRFVAVQIAVIGFGSEFRCVWEWFEHSWRTLTTGESALRVWP